jgi:ArsR family transcriptional regulator, arsenate/arsenite/antimonite-responsive transcriptional repressor
MNAAKATGAFAAIAHENRLAIFRLLVKRGPEGLPAGTIATRLGVVPSSLTFHLQALLHAGLLTRRRAGRQLIYSADFAAMNALVGFLTDHCCIETGTGAACCAPESSVASPRRKSVA